MKPIHEGRLEYLEELANKIREKVIEMLLEAGSGHSAGPLGMADIFTAFYFHILKHDPKKPMWPDRDRLVLVQRPYLPGLVCHTGLCRLLPFGRIDDAPKIGFSASGPSAPHRLLPGLETTSGPLGSGLSQAIGMALAAKLNDKKYRVYCLTSDGEHEEGNTWEAVMFAGKNKLNNLTVVVDRNNIQIDGFTENVMPLESLKAKYEAFNWHVLEIDGHNMQDLVDAVSEAEAIYEKPTVIIAHTIPGKGVDFMECDYKWHGKPPDKEEAKKALHELRTLGRRIKSEHE